MLTGSTRLIVALARLLDAAKPEIDHREAAAITLLATQLVNSLVTANLNRLLRSFGRGLSRFRPSTNIAPPLVEAVESFIAVARQMGDSPEIESALQELSTCNGRLIEHIQEAKNVATLNQRTQRDDQ